MLNTTQKNLWMMVLNNKGTDCSFKLRDSLKKDAAPKMVIFNAHKLILSATTPVFERMLADDWKQSEPIEIEGIEANTFRKFLK